MALVTVDEVRALVDVDESLSDDELMDVIDRAEAELVAQVGPHAEDGTVTETHLVTGNVIYLNRPVAEITSVTEYGGLSSSVDGTVLATTSYYPAIGTGILTRLSANWGARVVVTYTPADDDTQRRAVLIDLVRLHLQPAGANQESIKFADGAAYSYQQAGSTEAVKAKLFQQLRGIRL